MEDNYVTMMPIVYLVGAVLIFLLTSMLFVLYDYLVERRQRLVLREAEKSGAIVSSLFPAAYRDRLMKDQEDRLEAKDAPRESADAKGELLNSFMKGGADVFDSVANDDPIADLYQDCTVFFADIAVR
jgi:hypothetical protein